MRKLLQFLLLLLSAAIIAAGAFLPEILSSAMDASERQNLNSAPMEPVELDLRAREKADIHDSAESGGILQDMAIYQKTTSIPVTPDLATMNEQEALHAAERALEPYLNAGILTYFDPTYRTVEPYLFLDPDDTSRSILIWTVTFVRDGKGSYQSIVVHITDSGGKLLYLAADSLDSGIWEVNYPSGEVSSQQQVLYAVCKLYLDELDLTEIMNDSSSAVKEGSDSTWLRRYYIRYDEALGTIRIEFALSPSTLVIQVAN